MDESSPNKKRKWCGIIRLLFQFGKCSIFKRGDIVLDHENIYTCTNNCFCCTLFPSFKGAKCYHSHSVMFWSFVLLQTFLSYPIVSLPKLIDFDWRVDVKTSSNAISRMSMPTWIMQLQVSHRNTRFDASASSELWNVSSILVLQGWPFNKIQSSCWTEFYRLDSHN